MRQVSHKEVKKWYDQKYTQEQYQTMRPSWAYEVFLDYLPLQKGEQLLDVACGTGYLLERADARGLKVTGVDLSSSAVELSENLVPTAEVQQSSAEQLPFKNERFDYLTCLGSIEHFLDQQKALEEFKRVTQKQATFLFVVPNKNYLFDLIRGEHGTEQQAINEDLKSLKEWKNLFKQAGFSIQKITQDNWIRNSLTFNAKVSLFESLKILVKKVIWLVLPLRFTYQFVFVLQKQQ